MLLLHLLHPCIWQMHLFKVMCIAFKVCVIMHPLGIQPMTLVLQASWCTTVMAVSGTLLCSDALWVTRVNHLTVPWVTSWLTRITCIRPAGGNTSSPGWAALWGSRPVKRFLPPCTRTHTHAHTHTQRLVEEPVVCCRCLSESSHTLQLWWVLLHVCWRNERWIHLENRIHRKTWWSKHLNITITAH